MNDNPYQTPDSDLSTQTAQMPKTIWWKIFFFLYTFLVVIGLGTMAYTGELKIAVLETIDLILSVIALVGLFGLAFNKVIGKQSFWKYFFYLNLVVIVITGLIFPVFGIEMYGQVSEFNIEFAIGLLFAAPIVWASYLYAFKRSYIWDSFISSY